MFDKNEHGERICGVQSCPVWDVTISFNANSSLSLNDFHLISNLSATELMGIFVGFGVISLVLACFMGNIENGIRTESSRGMTDTLMFAGPMAYFIGTEQGYMLTDFTKVSHYQTISTYEFMYNNVDFIISSKVIVVFLYRIH